MLEEFVTPIFDEFDVNLKDIEYTDRGTDNGLQDDIAKNGIMTPPVIHLMWNTPERHYTCVEGNRRLAAAERLSMDEVKCRVLVGFRIQYVGNVEIRF